jgi:hypothetical protein
MRDEDRYETWDDENARFIEEDEEADLTEQYSQEVEDEQDWDDPDYQLYSPADACEVEELTVLPPVALAPAAPVVVHVHVHMHMPAAAPAQPVLALESEQQKQERRQAILTMRGWFNRALDELDQIYSLVNATHGFFTRHTYSVEELLHHEAFAKADAIVRKIDSDLQYHRRYDNDDLLLLHEFEIGRARVNDEISRILRLIQLRQPTFFERVRDWFVGLLARFTLRLASNHTLRITGW